MEDEIQVNMHKIIKYVSLRLPNVDNFHITTQFKWIT